MKPTVPTGKPKPTIDADLEAALLALLDNAIMTFSPVAIAALIALINQLLAKQKKLLLEHAS